MSVQARRARLRSEMSRSDSAINEMDETLRKEFDRLTYYGDQVNRCSQAKAHLEQQLAHELAQLDACQDEKLVLSGYFDLLYRLERCRRRIGRLRVEQSDVQLELLITENTITNLSLVVAQEGLPRTPTTTPLSSAPLPSAASAVVAEIEPSSVGCFPAVFRFRAARKKPASPPPPPTPIIATTISSSSLVTTVVPPGEMHTEILAQMQAKLARLNQRRHRVERSLMAAIGEFKHAEQRLCHFLLEHAHEVRSRQPEMEGYFHRRILINRLRARLEKLDQTVRHCRLRYRQTINSLQTISESIHRRRATGSGNNDEYHSE